MTPPAPARLWGFFAEGAPVCVIARRGPAKYSQLILWETDTDTFTPGQWFQGHIDFATLSHNGTHMAAGIRRVRTRRYAKEPEHELALVCRPPYVTALEVWLVWLLGTTVAFLPNDVLVGPRTEGNHKVLAPSPCPFLRVKDDNSYPREHKWTIDARRRPATGIDHRGRQITFEAGCVYGSEDGVRRLLLDTNPMKFEPIEAPEWAKDW